MVTANAWHLLSGTSWHADPPSAEIVGEAVDIALGAFDDGLVSGVITYCLNKTEPGNAWFEAVSARYWSGSGS